MKLSGFLVIIAILFFSCKKQDSMEEVKGSYIGNWSINEDIFFEPSEFSNMETPPLLIDTANLSIDGKGVLKPTHQPHEIFVNSNYLLLAPNSVFQFAVHDLLDGQYTFIYKSEIIDFTAIEKITVSIHAEQINSNTEIGDEDVSLIIRLCSSTDIANDYYEIECPLVLTKNTNNILSDIWPNQNFINLEVDKLKELTAKRDLLAEEQDLIQTSIYTKIEGKEKLSIYKNPDINNFNRLCIGLKNPGNFSPTSTPSRKFC